MKLDFKKPTRDIKGEPITTDGKPNGPKLMMSELLSQLLLNATGKVPTVKFYDWAVSLSETGSLELDTSDQKTLEQWIEAHESLTVLAKKKLLEVFDHKPKK